MTDAHDPIKQRLRELERSFSGFERGERNRLYESRDSLVGLAEAAEASGFDTLTPLCEMSGRLLGLVLMEGGLDEARSVQFVRELLGYIEGQFQALRGQGASAPGGVFHVVNSEKVGEILLRRGLIAPDQLEKALLLQRVSKGKRVGEVLLAMNAIDQRTLVDVLENQKGETRREETRRSGTLGKRSIQLAPLPPVPGPSSAPTLPPPPMASSPGGSPPLGPLPAAGPSQPHTSVHQVESSSFPAPLPLGGPMPGQPAPQSSSQQQDPQQQGAPPQSIPFTPPPAPAPLPAPPRRGSSAGDEDPEAS